MVHNLLGKTIIARFESIKKQSSLNIQHFFEKWRQENVLKFLTSAFSDQFKCFGLKKCSHNLKKFLFSFFFTTFHSVSGDVKHTMLVSSSRILPTRPKIRLNSI